MRVLFFSSYHAVCTYEYKVSCGRQPTEQRTRKAAHVPVLSSLVAAYVAWKISPHPHSPPPPKIWVGSFRLHLRPAASTAACTAPNAAVVHGRRREASSPSSPVTPPLPLSALNLVRGIARRPPSSPLVAFPPLSARRRPDIPSRGRLRRLLF